MVEKIEKIKCGFGKGKPLCFVLCLFIAANALAAGYTWTGAAGDGKWSTATNWKGKASPKSGSNTVTINGEGLVGGEMTNDIASLKISSLTFAGDVPFRLTGNQISINGNNNSFKKTSECCVTNCCDIACVRASSSFSMTSAGKGAFVLEGSFSDSTLKSGICLQLRGGVWVLSGENTQRGGMKMSANTSASIAVKEPQVTFANPKAIGADGTTLTVESGDVFFAANGDYHADFVSTETDDVTWNFVNPGNYHIYGQVSNENLAGFFYTRNIDPDCKDLGGSVTFHGDVYMPNAKYYPLHWRDWKISFMQKATFAATAGGNDIGEATAQLYFYATNAIGELHPNRQHRVFCQCPDAFPKTLLRCDVPGTASNVESETAEESGVFDLCGYRQTMDRVDNNGFFMGDGKEHGLITTPSGLPAALRLEGTASARTVSLLRGPLDLVWAPVNSSFVQAFSNRQHTISGSIVVTNGVLRFDGATTLAELQKIEVRTGGRFELDTPLESALGSLKTLTVADGSRVVVTSGPDVLSGGRCVISLGKTSLLKLPSGNSMIGGIFVDGKELEKGVYSGNKSSPNYLPQLEGDFTLEIRYSSGTATWTGLAGTRLWSTPGNWKNSSVPKNYSSVVLLNDDDDYEIVNDIAGLTLESVSFQGQRPFRLSGEAVVVRPMAAIFANTATASVTNSLVTTLPEGMMRVTTEGGADFVLDGGFRGSGAKVTLVANDADSSFYIGGTGTIDRITFASGTANIICADFLGEGATLEYPFDLRLMAGGNYKCDFEYTRVSGGDAVWFCCSHTSFDFYGAFGSEAMTGEYQMRNDAAGYLDFAVHFRNLVNFPNGTIHTVMSCPVTFHAKVTALDIHGGNLAENSEGDWRFASAAGVKTIMPAMTLRLSADAADVFGGALVSFERPTTESGDGAGRGRVDLNGYDQTIDRIQSDAVRLAQRSGVILSGGSQASGAPRAATLTLRGTASAVTAAKVVDRVSIVWNALDASFVQVFTNQENTTSGNLTAMNGTLRIEAGCSFANARNVIVGSGGTFVLDTTVAGALQSVETITVAPGGTFKVIAGEEPFTESLPTLDIRTGANVILPAKATYTMKGILRNRCPVKPGTYTSGTLPELKSGTLVAGELSGYGGLILRYR